MENKSDFQRALASPSCLHALQTKSYQTIWPELKIFLYMTEGTGFFFPNYARTLFMFIDDCYINPYNRKETKMGLGQRHVN